VDLVGATAFDPEVIEEAMDVLTASVQQVKEAVDRSPKVDPGSTDADNYIAEIRAAVVSTASDASTATTQAGLATTNGAAQVVLAAAQVSLATAQVGLATTARTGAETAQGLAEDARDAAVAAVGAVKVSSNDTTAGYLETKLLVGTDLSLSTQNDGAAETRTISLGTSIMRNDAVTARTRGHHFTPVAVTAAAGGALAIDCRLHEECTITLAETTTTVGAATYQAAGKYVVLIITGTTGKALAWHTNWHKDGVACTIDAPANGVVDMHCFRSNGSMMQHIGSKLAV